jgi:hypothetical protein
MFGVALRTSQLISRAPELTIMQVFSGTEVYETTTSNF